jgi:hypothetical protein
MADPSVLVTRNIVQSIHNVRGHRVMIDSDLAGLYGVTTKRLNEQLKRNRERFPPDFAFQLTAEEAASLKSQFATASAPAHGGRRNLPTAFTEHGALMAASVLNSPKAVEMSIFVVRAFVQLRGLLVAQRQVAAKLQELERKYVRHDHQIAALFDAIRDLMSVPARPKRRIGFEPGKR